MEKKKNLCDRRNYGGKRIEKVRYIVLHYTGNDGDTDENNGSYFAGNDTGKTSAHWFVDRDSATLSVPEDHVAWHCGAKNYRHDKCRNGNSIGVELCDGVPDFPAETLANAAQLVKELMAQYEVPLENVLRHYDVTGKICPAPLVDEGAWNGFKTRLKGEHDMSNTLSKADQSYLSERQQAEIRALKEAWAKANAAGDKAAAEAAHAKAEAIRASQGYSGGQDGSGGPQAGGKTAGEVQKWVNDYRYTNLDPQKGWVNGYSTEMNHRSMANYIRQQMEANSQAWAGSDRDTRNYLHQQNVQLAKILEEAVGGAKSTFNAEKGRWETDNANLGYGYNTGAFREQDKEFYHNVYKMTDEQMEAYRNDTSRYRNFVDQDLVRNWVDEGSGFTGIYAQFVNGPYAALLSGSRTVNPTTYKDVIGDGFNERDYKPPVDENGNVTPLKPKLKNNRGMGAYSDQFMSYVDENGVIQPGILKKTNPAGNARPGGGGDADYGGAMGGGSGGDSVLDRWKQAVEAQGVNETDYAVNQAVQQLLAAEAASKAQLQTQRDQIAGDERNALDNAALYAEARGDRGGIGQAQYNTIQAAADQNRRAVNTAQAQLRAETAQKVAELRAKGEFEKADHLLTVAQTYLLKLLDLQKWAAEYNLDVAKFQAGLRQWQLEYRMKAARAAE